MFKITFKGPSKGQIQAAMEKAVLEHSQKLVNERLANIKHEAKMKKASLLFRLLIKVTQLPLKALVRN